jgi:hypothetical protein
MLCKVCRLILVNFRSLFNLGGLDVNCCNPKLCDYPKSLSLQPRGSVGCSIRRTTRFSPSSTGQIQSAWALNKEDT